MSILEFDDLAKLRDAARISQEAMAAHLRTSQSQVSRYEQDPGNAPYAIVKAWIEYCGQISAKQGLEFGSPYRTIDSQLRLMGDYIETAPPPLDPAMFKNAPTGAEFLREVQYIGRKPRIAVCGQFDRGKSRLANTLMGSDALPTDYQPATSIINLVRHIDDRPSWLKEEVWIMRKGFDLNRANDLEHCNKHRIVAGSFDTLRKYGTYNEGRPVDAEECFAALVFVDSPFLQGCDLIDLPGYNSGEKEDHVKAELAQSLADILIYASSAQGFLDNQDLQFVGALLKQLPALEAQDENIPVLRNVFFVATLARQEQSELDGIILKSSKRAFKHLEENLQTRSEVIGRDITLAEFQSRFFAYLVDDPSRRKSFEDDLVGLLSKIYPVKVRGRLNKSVADLKNASKAYCDSWRSGLVVALENRDRAQGQLDLLERAEPRRLNRVNRKKADILEFITDSKAASKTFINRELSKLITPEYVGKIIRERYKDDKKEAQQLAPSYIAEHVQNKLSKFLGMRAEGLKQEISEILADYQAAGNVEGGIELGALELGFNAQGVFLGALAAAGTFGALAAWAAATASSGVLLPGTIGTLSAAGIAAGGAATGTSLVAALGGPIGVMIGMAAMAVFAIYALATSSWETRLSKKICETLKDKKLLEVLTEHALKYWDDAQAGFEKGIEATEEAFQDNLQSLRKLVNASSREEMTKLIAGVEATRDFFGGIPWRSGM